MAIFGNFTKTKTRIMRIYIGKWSLLPANWEGYNGLYERSEEEIAAEISRQSKVCIDSHAEDDYTGEYTPIEFEETFNGDNNAELHGTTYFIKIF